MYVVYWVVLLQCHSSGYFRFLFNSLSMIFTDFYSSNINIYDFLTY